MYPHLIPTLAALGIADPSEEQVAILTAAFNRTKADDVAYNVREFTPEGASPRYFGQDASGQSIVIVAEALPEIGALVHTGGKSYYVESHFVAQDEIAKATTRTPSQKQANGR